MTNVGGSATSSQVGRHMEQSYTCDNRRGHGDYQLLSNAEFQLW